ncbi:acetolactate synthase small subunit [Eubacterium sp. AB3007]|uniref:acetolactate synthase small subunit n=1 Tax=Eubacterium sp. AB3007 TaxID=1392487 RepID=UPI0005567DAD|nr:acetolactate synthase small subunit [Eubacterium sp. AB3007]
MATEYKKRIVSVLVENAPNVMTRVSSVLGRRGFNIDTITVSTTNNPDITRITIVFNVEEQYIPQIMKQLEKVEVVKKVTLLTRETNLYRELLLVNLRVGPEERDRVLNIVRVYKGHVVDLTTTNMVIEMTGYPEKIDGFLEIIQGYTIADYTRSGVTAVESSEQNTKLQ